MKLLNYTTSWFAAIILIVIPLWAGIFYYSMLDEIYDSIDDGLDNRKGLIIKKAEADSAMLYKQQFDEGDYAITAISATPAKIFKDQYIDTSMYMQNENDYEPVRLLRTVFLQNGKYYRLDVITSMVEEDDLISELLSALIMLYMGLVITVVIVNNFVLQRSWRPFYRLLEQLGKFRLDRPSDIFPEDTKVEEFRVLQDTIQKMLQSNINSYSSQKQFIENAAHELQTPLAITINKLEAIAASEQLSENETTLLSGAMDNLDRLSRLNRSLLLLTRIENRQYSSDEDINLNELTQKLIDDFSELRLFRNIGITVNEEAVCTITINKDMAAILLSNLIKNAITHTEKGGSANITIRSTSWSVKNTSDGNPLDHEQIFTRFYKQNASSPSTGLGLSIARAIADLYGFRIAYTHEGMHCFTIYF